MAAGQRPINNVVDITNYVMLLTGQPLHAFDLDLVAGGQARRPARAGTARRCTRSTMTSARSTPTMFLIDDADGPTSIAGIMGGQRSEVQPNHDARPDGGGELERPEHPAHVAASSACAARPSGRFEKGLAPEQAMEAQAVATQLMLELRARAWSPGTVDVGGAGPGAADDPPARREGHAPARHRGAARASRPSILERLEFGVDDAGDGLDVTVPAFRRNDVTREVDLIEEVARLWGLEKLPATIPGHGVERRASRSSSACAAAPSDVLVGRGLQRGDRLELPVAGDRPRSCGSTRPPCVLRNPLSEDLSEMRTTLLGSLLDGVRHNTARGAEDVRLFEEGSVYFDRPHGASRPRPRRARRRCRTSGCTSPR